MTELERAQAVNTQMAEVLKGWIEFKRRWWTNIPAPGGQTQREEQRALMEATIAALRIQEIAT